MIEAHKRIGKTAKDRASGAASRNESNKSARVTWQQDTSSAKVFPKTTCNGKKNHNRWTGKNNQTVIMA